MRKSPNSSGSARIDTSVFNLWQRQHLTKGRGHYFVDYAPRCLMFGEFEVSSSGEGGIMVEKWNSQTMDCGYAARGTLKPLGAS